VVDSSREGEWVVVCSDSTAVACCEWRNGIIGVVSVLTGERVVHRDHRRCWEDVGCVPAASGAERALIIVVILVRTNDELAHELAAEAVEIGAVELGVRLFLEELFCGKVSNAVDEMQEVELAYRVG